MSMVFTLFVIELWGMTADREDNKRIQVQLERAVQVILRAQSPLGGWRYHARPDCGQIPQLRRWSSLHRIRSSS